MTSVQEQDGLSESRTSIRSGANHPPKATAAFLAVFFIVFCLLGIFTVLLPEIRDESEIEDPKSETDQQVF
ncbi:MAG: hypothetical protein AAF355_01650 [Myxococcota bacterium]